MTNTPTAPTGHPSRARSCPSCRGLARDGHLCWKCTRATRKALSRIAGLWPTLQEAITRQDRLQPPSEVRGSTVYGPLPFRPVAAEVARKVQSDLRRWCRVCVDDLGAPRPLDLVPVMCRLLASSSGELRRHELAAAWANDITSSVEAIVHTIDLADRRATAGPCPERTTDGEPCAGVVVAVYPVDETQRPHMDCTKPAADVAVCGRSWHPEEWDVLGRRVLERRRQVDEQKRRGRTEPESLQVLDLQPPEWIGARPLLTVQDASTVCGVPKSTLYRWLAEGRLRTYEIPASPNSPVRLKVVHPGDVSRERVRSIDELEGLDAIDVATRRANIRLLDKP